MTEEHIVGFDIFHIKTPQLMGIIAGCVVFTVTLGSVFILMYQSGTFSRFVEEMNSGKPIELPSTKKPKEKMNGATTRPLLYDNLIAAASSLPLKPDIAVLHGRNIVVREYVHKQDFDDILRVSDGNPIYHESAYDPFLRIWSSIGLSSPSRKCNSDYTNDNISEVIADIYATPDPNASHFVILEDLEKDAKPIGMVSVINNVPKWLTAQIDNIWLTPAFQGKQIAHEAVFLILQHLMNTCSYRRITCELDTSNVIGKKLLERIGFREEAVLRKSRIVNNRNSDIALYVILNSEWQEVEIKLKKLLGFSIRKATHHIAEIESIDEIKELVEKRDAAKAAKAKKSKTEQTQQNPKDKTGAKSDKVANAKETGSGSKKKKKKN